MVVLGQATAAPGYTVSTFEVPTKHEMPSKKCCRQPNKVSMDFLEAWCSPPAAAGSTFSPQGAESVVPSTIAGWTQGQSNVKRSIDH